MAIVTRFDLLKNRRTKIVATIGPASGTPDMCRRLIEAGVNVFRLNMSHGDHETHVTAFGNICDAGQLLQLPVAVMADLCGPKIRTGRFEKGGIELQSGARVTITTRPVTGTGLLIPSQYKAIVQDVMAGDRILLADGLIELKAISVEGTEIVCDVIHGGPVGDHKGINLPGVNVSAPSMTEKDFADARFAIDLGVDFIALSFVRRASDVEQLRRLLDEEKSTIHIIAKIEKPEALENAESILEVADGIMVARGDLGVELPPEEVPVAQDELITMARARGKPVIVATQMLESMITQSRPTRAEVTDVSHAVVSGADAVMLSGETAVGQYPVEAVEIMDRVAKQTEAHLWSQGHYGLVTANREPPLPVWTVIANSTSNMSRDLMARAVMVISKSGATATTVSAARPAAPVVAITSEVAIYQRMAMLWGVIPLLVDEAGKEKPNEVARGVAQQLELAEPGQYVLLVRGFHEDPELNSPSVTVITV
ncbi:MAG: pyruvate kinase [Pseudomonadales bacterium]